MTNLRKLTFIHSDFQLSRINFKLFTDALITLPDTSALHLHGRVHHPSTLLRHFYPLGPRRGGPTVSHLTFTLAHGTFFDALGFSDNLIVGDLLFKDRTGRTLLGALWNEVLLGHAIGYW